MQCPAAPDMHPRPTRRLTDCRRAECRARLRASELVLHRCGQCRSEVAVSTSTEQVVHSYSSLTNFTQQQQLQQQVVAQYRLTAAGCTLILTRATGDLFLVSGTAVAVALLSLCCHSADDRMCTKADLALCHAARCNSHRASRDIIESRNTNVLAVLAVSHSLTTHPYCTATRSWISSSLAASTIITEATVHTPRIYVP